MAAQRIRKGRREQLVRATLPLLLLLRPTSPKTITVPTDSIRSPVQIRELLGEPPPTPDAPEGFTWSSYGGKVNVSTSVLFPLEGTVVAPHFEVMVEVAASPLGVFRERYGNAMHCLSIDGTPPACWPVLDDDAPLPRFVHVSEGEHTLRSAITDPSGEWIEPESWSTLRRFVVKDPKESDDAGNGASGGGDEENGAKGEANEGNGGAFQIEIPVASIRSPPEMSVITSRFIDMAYAVVTPDPEGFETHFSAAFACGSLDGAPHVCWPLFNVSHNPRWIGLKEGVHTLQAAVTHPNTGDEIDESVSELRAFIILADEHFNENVMAIAGSSATAAPHGGGAHGGSSPADSGWSDDRENYIVLDIDIGHRLHTETHVTYKLPVQRGADFVFAAERFCAARGVGNAECSESIVKDIYAKFEELDKEVLKRTKAREAAAAAAAEEAKRRVQTPEGDGFLIIPELNKGGSGGAGALDAQELNERMHAAVGVCRSEYDEGEVGLECLTQQSVLFGLREGLEPSDQEALLEFIGNLGAGFGF